MFREKIRLSRHTGDNYTGITCMYRTEFSLFCFLAVVVVVVVFVYRMIPRITHDVLQKI